MDDPGWRPRERWLRVVREDEVPEPPSSTRPPASPPALPPAPPLAPGRPPPGAAPRPPPPPPQASGSQPARPELARARTAVQGAVPDGGPRVSGRTRALVALLGTVGVGTVATLGIDVLLGPVDGEPPLHLLVVLALPFWDGLPARLGPRVLLLAAVVGATAAAWLVLAGLRPDPWWRAEVSFGLACALVGIVQAALSARKRPGRTVER